MIALYLIAALGLYFALACAVGRFLRLSQTKQFGAREEM